MKKITLLTTIIMALMLAACSGNAVATPIPTVVLGSSSSGTGQQTTASASSSGGVTASGIVVPEPKASLSFPLTGTVKTVDVKAGDQVTKGQKLATLDTTVLDAQVKEAEASLTAAQANVRYLIRTGTDQEHIDAANADVQQAQASLDAANATVALATLTAPFDGTIASVDTAPAETAVPGQEVFMIGNLSNFRVETTDLSERDAPMVQIGQNATVSVIALNQQFPGRVIDISRVSSTVGGDVVYKVTIEFNSQPKGLLWGMTTDVSIATK